MSGNSSEFYFMYQGTPVITSSTNVLCQRVRHISLNEDHYPITRGHCLDSAHVHSWFTMQVLLLATTSP